MSLPIDKIGPAMIAQILTDSFLRISEDFRYASKEEREDFFSKNIDLITLYNLFIPKRVFLSDKDGVRSSLPYEVFSDKDFILEDEEKIPCLACDLIIWNDLIKDEFFVFGKTIELLNLAQSEKDHIYWVLFSNLLHERVKIFNRYKLDSVEYKAEQYNDLTIYSYFIVTEEIETGKLEQVKSQIAYYNTQVNYEAWRELIDAISSTLQKTHSDVLNAITNLLKEPNNENFSYISDKLFEFRSSRGLRSRLNKNSHSEYDEYTISQLSRTLDYMISLNNFKSQNSNFITMGDSYHVNQAGAVGPNSTASNNTFNNVNYSIPGNLDYDVLRREIVLLKNKLIEDATSSEHFSSISEIVKVEEAIDRKDGEGVVNHLKLAGSWVLQKAQEIAVAVTAEIIAKQMGS